MIFWSPAQSHPSPWSSSCSILDAHCTLSPPPPIKKKALFFFLPAMVNIFLPLDYDWYFVLFFLVFFSREEKRVHDVEPIVHFCHGSLK